jgi:hypothetical protein
MTHPPIVVGRVLRSSTTGYTIGTKALKAEVPYFGDFVKVHVSSGCDVVGLIADVVIRDDPFIRQLAAPDVDQEIIADHRENRLAIEVSVVVIGYVEQDCFHQHLPIQPPTALEEIWTCTDSEIASFTQSDLTFFQTVLGSKDSQTDELLAASLRRAAATHEDSRKFLIKAGRELSRLFAFDMIRLDGLFRRIKQYKAGKL